jgi:hypothetical protein
MRIDKRMLDSVDAETDFGRIICCALYLNEKSKKHENGATIHEQVALLTLKGNDAVQIANKTGFETRTVIYALSDITAYCEARG